MPAGIEFKLKRIDEALQRLSVHRTNCRLCPRECGVNRKKGEKGFCQTGDEASVSRALLHYGEEPILSGIHDCVARKEVSSEGRSGSGTVFFTGCNLKCLFCQNFQLSWLGQGRVVSAEELSGMMVELEKKKALNINLVSPTHLVLPILRALRLAYNKGLSLPLVYNSNGYEKASVIKELEGIIDIYLPDLKYFSRRVSHRFADAPDYFERASIVLLEMHRQKPELRLSGEEIAEEGLLIRHLVLPGQTDDSIALLDWIASSLSPQVALSLMSQYQPCYKAPLELQRPLWPYDYQRLLARADELGLENFFIQPESFTPDEHLVPDFNLAEPFSWDKNSEGK